MNQKSKTGLQDPSPQISEAPASDRERNTELVTKKQTIDKISVQSDYETAWLIEKESLMLSTLNQKVHPAYYSRWLKERNQLLRLVVRLKTRKDRLMVTGNEANSTPKAPAPKKMSET